MRTCFKNIYFMIKKIFLFSFIIFFIGTPTYSASAITMDIEQIRKTKIIVKKSIKKNKISNEDFYLNKTNIDKCKIKDITVNKNIQLISSGFERFTFNNFKDSNNISLIVLPVSFKDLLFTDEDFINLNKEMKVVQDFFYFNSYKKANIKYIIPEKKYWIFLPKIMHEYGLSSEGKKISQDFLVQEIFNNAHKDLKLSSYDIVAIQTNNKTDYYFAGGLLKTKGSEFIFYGDKIHSVILDGGKTSGNWITIAHELGHAWLGFEDLYNHFDYSNPMKSWDLMANAYNSELLGWHRWSSGWLNDDQIICLDYSLASFTKLEKLNDIGNNKLISIPIENGKSIFIEYRTSSNYYIGKNTVIAYFVDTSIWHGYAPYKILKEFSQEDNTLIAYNIKISIDKFFNNEVYVKIN